MSCREVPSLTHRGPGTQTGHTREVDVTTEDRRDDDPGGRTGVGGEEVETTQGGYVCRRTCDEDGRERRSR